MRQDQWMSVAQKAADMAKKFILQNMADIRQVESSHLKDVKVKADKASESVILSYLQAETPFPVLSEESSASPFSLNYEQEYLWIVDPLDGSLNFSRGMPLYCLSIALWRKGEPFLGVIYDLTRDELFQAQVGQGAFLNGRPIQCAEVSRVDQAVLCTGFPVASDFSTEGIEGLLKQIQQFKKVRMLGSAALSLAYVACGRADAYLERDIRLWDVAAGLAMVQAAGGRIAYQESRNPTTLYVSATNGKLEGL